MGLSAARWLVADALRAISNREKIGGVDQVMRFKARERARTGGGLAQCRHGVRVREHEDGRAVVLSEHPVVRPRLPPTDSARSRTTAARLEGRSRNLLIVSPVRLKRTRYFATVTTPTYSNADCLPLPPSIALSDFRLNQHSRRVDERHT